MSRRQIVTSSSNKTRLQKASHYLESLLGDSEILVLAPTRGAADDFVRACCDYRQAFYGVHRMTLTHVAASLATELLARQNFAPVTRLSTEALAARSVYACRKDGELGYFRPVADTPGFARALASTLTELRLEGVNSGRLAATGAPGKDLARLLACYQALLETRSLADLAVVFRLAADVAHHSTHRLLGLPALFLDVSVDSASERALVAALAYRSPAVFATALAEDEEGIRTLEEILGVKAERLSVAAVSDRRAAVGTPPLQKPAGAHRAPLQDSDENSLERLRRYLFSPAIAPQERLDPSVEFFSAPGEGLECVEIARRMHFSAQAGVAFDQMAILLRHPEGYLPLVEDALRRAEIPAYFTKGTIRPDPSGRAFLALLDCAAESLSASKFSEYLSLGQLPTVDESGAPRKPTGIWVAPEDELQSTLKAPPPEVSEKTRGEPGADLETNESPVIDGTLRAPFGWEKLLIDAAVIGGKERWSRRLRGLEAEYRIQLDELAGEDDSRHEHLEKQLERLKHLQGFALPVIEFLDSLPRSARWGDWLEALERLAEMALRQPQSVLSVLNELQPMDAVGPVGLNEVRQVLTERLRFLRREPPERRYGRVFVGAISEVSARSFEIVFLPGLAEGIFPRRAFEDPLLLDEYRANLDPALSTQNKRVRRERLLLYGAAAAARSRLCVSYPRMDVVQGRARVPSFYALEVLRAAQGRLPALRELEKGAAEASQGWLGWPAPKNSSDAIDDTEHDLALLEQLIRKPPKEVKGHARYLLSANANLARSLRTRRDRWKKAWSSADGIVDPDKSTLRVLATQRLNVRSYSPSALQHFAACPYRFLLYAIHRLQEREEALAIEKLDPLTRGGIFHAVQFQTFSELERAGLLPIKEEDLPKVLDVADRVLDRAAAKYEEDLAPAIPQIWKTEMEDLRTDLRGWIRQLVSVHAEWRPIHFEYAFGLPLGGERDPKSSPDEAVILDGLRLRGSIDLIERHQTRDVLRVTDHKTGKVPAQLPVSVGGGEVLQPLLYGLAVEKLFGQKVESGVLFYCTRRGSYTPAPVPLNEADRARISHVIKEIDAAVEKGFLPAAPKKDACTLCDYRMVCGPYEERRVKLKPQERLDALQQLRCLP